MQQDYLDSNNFRVPSFARAEAYDFDAGNKMMEIYKELDQISEEIEKCRAKNS
ncbi:hypothetical protein IKE87_01945 [Candidatus Saccharibacteria bacterium]|nr:hypothetical protein [Candidatus Saccharibacteria bacterium]